MTDLRIYQVGLGSFGRYGFEKLVEMHNHLEEVDVKLCGVADKDFDRLEAAERFAESNGIDIETFTTDQELYDAASREEGDVMVYDAGPAEAHSSHIQRSLQEGFYHLTEKPPSLTRDGHLREKRLAEDSQVFYKVDFIERESPVVRRAIELLEDEDIESIKIFRESSAGVQKVLQPAERAGVKGGDVLDKMVHEVYVLDMLEAAGEEPALELEDAETRYFVPKQPGSERLMSIDGGVTREIDADAATGATKAAFRDGNARVELHSSWLGLSEEAEDAASRIQDATGEDVLERQYTRAGDAAFSSEEARFFIVEGSRSLAGDMLHRRLYDLDSGEELETPDLLHDQLYRVIERAVLAAKGETVDLEIGEREIDTFMTALFDARDRALENADDYLDELEAANERLQQLIVRDSELEEVEA